mgnify:FL=1
MIMSSSTSDRQKYVAELKRGSCSLLLRQPLTNSRFDGPSPLGLTMEPFVELQEITFGASPFKFWQRHTVGVQPRSLSGFMTISSLLNTTRPTVESVHPISTNPATPTWRPNQTVRRPSGGALRMFQDSAPGADSRKCGLEASAIVTLLEAWPGCRRPAPVAPPTLARRVGRHRPRTSIEAGVPVFVPGLDVWQTKIAAARRYEESRDHARPRRSQRI